MNITKSIFSILFLIFLNSNNTWAQNNGLILSSYFSVQQQKLDSIYNIKIASKKARGVILPEFDKSSLAALTDSYILFRQEDDIRANKTSNIDFIQNGLVADVPLLGTNISIAIFDGGTVLKTHNEFQSNQISRIINLEDNVSPFQQSISTHATAVAGFIGGKGASSFTLNNNLILNASRGVLPVSTIKVAGFRETDNGNIYKKIELYNEPISNHSYGINFAWRISSIDYRTKTVTLEYPVDTNYFFNDQETFVGAYLQDDANYDLLISTYPKLTVVKSAGNYYGIGPDAYDASWIKILKKYSSTTNSFVQLTESDIIPKTNSFNGAYSISTGSLAKNIITVGAIELPAESEDFRVNSASAIQRYSYSSVGPRKDGGVKPDLVAVGANVIHPTSESDYSYSYGSGTSYSAPKVTGVAGALTELYRNLSTDYSFLYDSDQLKAILLHSANDIGNPGPDIQFGWGVLDAKKASELVLSTFNDESFFEKIIKFEGQDFVRTISARENNDLKVTLAWIDPPFLNYPKDARGQIEDTSTRIINDLDLRVVDTETNQVYYPWKLDISNVTAPAITGDNTVDNVEQILIKNPVAGRNYKVVVSNKGKLYDYNENATGTQAYTLLITGANEEVLSSDKDDFIAKVIVYPTIASNVVNIATESDIQLVEVFDLSGKSVLKTTNNKTVQVSNLSSGLYILKITTTKGDILTKKFIKE